jgi:hypothetical protein
MPLYNVEVIHELTGAFMTFQIESDLPEDMLYTEIMPDLSVVAFVDEE